jgi:hypothetical protein
MRRYDPTSPEVAVLAIVLSGELKNIRHSKDPKVAKARARLRNALKLFEKYHGKAAALKAEMDRDTAEREAAKAEAEAERERMKDPLYRMRKLAAIVPADMREAYESLPGAIVWGK